MTRRHLRPAHRGPARRVDRAHDDRGSIVLVLLIIIASSILVLTVAGIAISQQVVAEHTVQRNDALEAAEAGLDAAVGELRVANNGAGNGEVEDLPCTGSDNFSLTGYLGGTSTATYTVTVTYYQSVEPTNTNIANGAAQPVSCYTAVTPGYPDRGPVLRRNRIGRTRPERWPDKGTEPDNPGDLCLPRHQPERRGRGHRRLQLRR